MAKFKLIETESFETTNVFKLEGGDVTIVERELHELYAPERSTGTRLIIENAVESTRNFISRSRADIAELNSVLRELTVK